MLKIIILSFLAAAQAANIETFLGPWTPVAVYPRPNEVKTMCNKFRLARDSANTDCTCADGKKASLVSLSVLKEDVKENQNFDTSPVMALDSVKGVPLDVSCKCGAYDYAPRLALRAINDNYIVLYEKRNYREYTEADPYNIVIFAKKVSKNVDLLAVLQGDEELKNKGLTVMCASDLSI